MKDRQVCAWCETQLSDEDIRDERSVCASCRNAGRRSTLARVHRLLKQKDDLSKVAGWSIVRELAGQRYGHERSDEQLLRRTTGRIEDVTGKCRDAVLSMPLSVVKEILKHGKPVKSGSKPKKPRGRKKAPMGKILLGQALQYDWLVYKDAGKPTRGKDEFFDDWRIDIDNGLSGDFEISDEQAKELRRWFTGTHTRSNKKRRGHPEDAVSLKKGFDLCDDDKIAITEWVESDKRKRKK